MLNLGAAIISSRQSYFGLAVLIALVSLVWLQEQNGDTSPALPTSEDGRIPAYYFKELSAVSMDIQGEVVERFETASLSFFQEDVISEVDRPVLRLYRQDKGDWVLSSDRAKIYGDWASAWLEGEVDIQRLAHEDLAPMTIRTKDLWLYPDKQYAETDGSVLIVNDLGRTQGEGMTVDLAKGRVELLSAVQGTYVLKDH